MDRVGNRVSPKVDQIGEILQRVIPGLVGRSKVFNLSMGADVIKSRSYSPVARLLDFLAREHKVLFVISAGNIQAPASAPPAHYQPDQSRILVPAEALLALSVGSIAKYCEPQCVAQQQEVSPFSRRGPGADSALKPELAAHGGNVFFNSTGWTTSPRMASYGVSRSGQALAYGIGTSYAAPLVSQSAARLFDAYPEASPNLVRALLCHFTDTVIAPQAGPPLCDHDFCGFGEPNIDKALFAGPASATFFYQGDIVKDTYQFVPFHIPSALAQAASGRLRIRGTLVFDPPVSPDDAVEYSRCRMACRLLKRRAEDLIEVALGGEEEDALYPWNPLFHFEKSFRRGYSAGEWELRLRLMTRGGLPEDFAQSFAVVLDVMDEAGRVSVLDEILAEFPGLYIPASLRLAA